MSRVFMPGETGFLGQHLARRIPTTMQRHGDYTVFANALNAMADSKASVVVNAAGKVGGIGCNDTKPAEFFYENLMIGANLMEAARQVGVKKYVQIGTVCSYPKDAPLPMKEADFWNGNPEETNGPYGHAKRAIIVQGQAYAKHYHFQVLLPVLANLYGPGDHYEVERSHVIPAMIRKFCEAVEKGARCLTFWGSGLCTREFLYVEDAADAIKFLLDHYDSPEIVNVATGKEIRIRDLAELVASACGYQGDIVWDITKPDGQPRRLFDTSKLAKLGWSAKVDLTDGIAQCVADFKKPKEIQCSVSSSLATALI